MGRTRNKPQRPPHLAGITEYSPRFSANRFRVEIKVHGVNICCAWYQTHEKAVLGRRLALHWRKRGYLITEAYTHYESRF